MGQDQNDQFWDLVGKKLSGEATPEELIAIEQLLREHPELHYPLQTITELWDQKGPGMQTSAEDAYDRHLSRMKGIGVEVRPDDQAETGKRYDRRRTRRSRVLGISLVALTLTCLFIYRATVNRTGGTAIAANSLSEVTTHNGSRTNLFLPDGTRVWLNAGSRITYDKHFGATGREVTLSGEAFFDVAPDPARPFLIHATHIDIRVLGTSFNVKSYPTDKTTETVLIRGSIEVAIRDKRHEKIILKPNEKLIVANEDTIQQRHPMIRPANVPAPEQARVTTPTYERNTGAIVETSWVNNELIFQDERFGDLARKLERWYGVSIRFADPGIEDLRLTATFRDETITEALDALRLTAPFSYTINDNQITIAK